MQIGLIKDRLKAIEQTVDQVARTCLLSPNAPDELRSAIGELERESDEARRMVDVETAEDRVKACVDRLEEVGDRMMQVCNDARLVDPTLQDAVARAHDMISSLKHQLH
ncbi:MAG TPA: hypothetical protein VIM12_03030 [Noviherbaspirillum sp.]|jgi:hypothetical protein|uniref:hypothetical protein n=1 Tax=Noviherbaspirillum sp. TaxID=1926288 RepID=UPI002F928525